MLKQYILSENRITDATENGTVLVYINPTDVEKRYLADVLKIDEHTMLSSLDPNELGRLEFEPDHTALIIKRPKRYNAKDNFLFKIESIGLFLFSNKLVILLSEDIFIFESKLFTKIESIQDLVLKIIYQASNHFEEHIKVISMISDELEKEINKSISNKQLLNMFTLEKSLVFYLEGISSNNRVIERVKSNVQKFSFTTANIEYLDDLIIENSQCYEMAQIYSQVISSLMDARASVISNNLNVMMKNLNALVIAVAVPSFFAGVGGMSEFSGMINFSNWKLGYPFFISAMILLGAVTFYIIKKIERFWK